VREVNARGISPPMPIPITKQVMTICGKLQAKLLITIHHGAHGPLAFGVRNPGEHPQALTHHHHDRRFWSAGRVWKERQP